MDVEKFTVLSELCGRIASALADLVRNQSFYGQACRGAYRPYYQLLSQVLHAY